MSEVILELKGRGYRIGLARRKQVYKVYVARDGLSKSLTAGINLYRAVRTLVRISEAYGVAPPEWLRWFVEPWFPFIAIFWGLEPLDSMEGFALEVRQTYEKAYRFKGILLSPDRTAGLIEDEEESRGFLGEVIPVMVLPVRHLLRRERFRGRRYSQLTLEKAYRYVRIMGYEAVKIGQNRGGILLLECPAGPVLVLAPLLE